MCLYVRVCLPVCVGMHLYAVKSSLSRKNVILKIAILRQMIPLRSLA